MNIFSTIINQLMNMPFSFEQVYNVTAFLDEHPGGDEIILKATGILCICTN